MPEYLAPGVYVEETSFRSKSIEGVSTTTTGFIGPTRYGPVELEPDIITSLGEFERAYGDGGQLTYGDLTMDNFTWHAARAFFTEGGKRLYVSRVFLPLAAPETDRSQDGHASLAVNGVTFRARYPGAYGNFTLRLTMRSGRNILGRVTGPDGQPRATLGALAEHDVVWIRNDVSSPPGSGSSPGDVFMVERDPTAPPPAWRFRGALGSPIASPLITSPLDQLVPDPQPGVGDSVRVVTLTVEVLDTNHLPLGIWPELPIAPGHRTGGLADSLFDVFGDGSESSALPIVVSSGAGLSALDVLAALFGSYDGVTNDFSDGDLLAAGITRDIVLEGGNDGRRPGATEYEGKADPNSLTKTGLKQLEALEDISIVAAPGSTWNYYGDYQDDANTIIGLLLAHARDMRYRIAVIDSAQKQTIADVRKMRAKLDSKYGALYYPWVKVLDPITRKPITLPPSGFVAGIYARNDIARAVYKAPANEVVNLALGFEMLLSKAQQEVLNPEGVNCFRYFEGRGMLLWGARTVSSDPEWKYVNLRRYFAYLERSVDRGTQWAVFEPNGERLWANVRRTVEDFLLNEWQMGALLGDKPEKAYFVRCDRTTMSQNDLDNGRLVCLVGVAALKPAEFVVFRIGQWTADSKV
ncbi:MAG TPA: phage tail sheath subtilisin-like domain-containing protein [Gemmatimonadaceae bacterium]|nr:phage tail sheath subtilisin-like domain-containing protein [Gemmatimonadaceae bacterium]